MERNADKETAIGRDTNRTLLYKVVPLKIPFAVGIAPSDVCNFKCIYCNQATENGIRDARVISMDDFYIIAKQLQEMMDISGEKFRIIRFIGNGEPLVNKNLPEMIKYVAEHRVADRYEVTTNGSLLTSDMSDRLIDAGLTRLLISVQGITEEKYKKICGFTLDYDRFVKQIKYFYDRSRGKCKLLIKTVNVALDDHQEDKERFYSLFESICDEINVENIIPSSEGVDFNQMLTEDELKLSRYNGEEIKEKKCCDTLFTSVNIHSNGDVDTCGCIYPPRFIGNLFKTSLSRLWNGETHKDIMIKHLTGRRGEVPVCSHCASINRHNTFEEDNLDGHLDEVLKRVLELK